MSDARSEAANIEMEGRNWFECRNWWKIGFFVVLVAFELARELVVVAAADRPTMSVTKSILSYDDWIHAQGRWRRSDGGDKLTPGMIVIDCYRSSNSCRVIEVTTYEDSVFAPKVSKYPAEVGRDGASYSWNAGCVRYDVDISVKSGIATSVRSRLPKDQQRPVSSCESILEDRIEMVLSDGFNTDDFNFPEGKFIPILRLLRWLSS